MIFRMNADEGVEGITPEEGREFAGLLEKAGVDALHVSGGVYGSPLPIIATMYEPDRRWHITPPVSGPVSRSVIAVARSMIPKSESNSSPGVKLILSLSAVG